MPPLEILRPSYVRSVEGTTLVPVQPAGPSKKKGLVLCGGGDAPGMNAAIAGFALGLLRVGWQPWGVMHGWSGLTHKDGLFYPLTKELVDRFRGRSGAFLGTGDREAGPLDVIKGIQDPMANAIQHLEHFEGVFVIGGNGSGFVCEKLLEKGVRVLFTPGTIDGDMPMNCIGFASAAEEGAGSVRKIASTGDSCSAVMVVEVMGVKNGALPLQVGIAGNADYIIIPEVVVDVEKDILELQKILSPAQ